MSKDDFDRAVGSIARRKAIWFFASRLTLIALGLVIIWSVKP